MEDFFSLFVVIIGVVASIASAARKAEVRRQAAAAAAKPAAPKPAAKPAPRPLAPAQPTVVMPMSFGDVPGQVIAPAAPMVHPHVEPDCETHDVPGSLGVTSTEGKDPCHEEQLTHARTFVEPETEEGGLTLEWSGQNMVKAFIMQEVLTRPCQRKAR